ncbi:type I restriction-modification system subunit M [Methanobrevibacter filiformis]|uniref:site-specific DNA-methyltransferase (adenine-specific) n=1 Tax=Methanobrevibacter filiformis TaxID=55758 RepID=A0A165ZEK5_9EURY|nr:type I restriction-modification system subunit M [Methanobrevibacter filiformis]KZX10612.1 putative type I restriction enzymeP M protein [Methanobrevibacter filiformis]
MIGGDNIVIEDQILSIINKFKNNIEEDVFENYFLGFIFYMHMSYEMEMYLNNKLNSYNSNLSAVYEKKKYESNLRKDGIDNLGYFLEPKYLFSNIIKKTKYHRLIIESLEKAFKKIEESTKGQISENAFKNIFKDIDLHSPKIGKKPENRIKLITDLLIQLSQIDFKINDSKYIFEYLIAIFPKYAGRISADSQTPNQVSKIMAQIVANSKITIENVYDPNCGSGTLMLELNQETKVLKFYGQDSNQTNYNVARMNMIIHRIPYDNFDIRKEDSLENPAYIGKKFEAIISKPPFTSKWSQDPDFITDPRFKDYGILAPKSKPDFSFIQHALFYLNNNGTLAIVLPPGILFRGSSEKQIRKQLIEKNYLDAVIGLPSNLFPKTTTPTVILVFKKSRSTEDKILFINASKNYKKSKNQNIIMEEDIDKIIAIYKNKEEQSKFSHLATLDEIRENDYNLNISRYVDTFEEEPLDLDELKSELRFIDRKIDNIDHEIKRYCRELGIRDLVY